MRYWVGVVSLAHTEIGVDGGFCQFNHGKRTAVGSMSPGDRFAIYSPREAIRGGESIQAFTAVGEVLPSAVYRVADGEFRPFRRDARYFASSRAPIRPLLEKLTFTRGKGTSWGQVLRRGFFEISENDFELIAAAMETGSDICRSACG